MATELAIVHATSEDGSGQGFRTDSVKATFDSGQAYVAPEDVGRVLGWSLRDEGLCRGDVCIPVRDRAALVNDAGIDLIKLAEILERPLALDVEESAAALGVGAGLRARSMESLAAPDFELPDLTGRMHRLSDYRGKKVLLIAHASW